MGPRIEIDVARSSTECSGVGRLPDGRVVFVDGALPGERVEAEIVGEARRHARAVVVEVLDASPARVAAPCPESARGCGGCDLGHASPALQLDLKVSAVADAFERIGRLDRPQVEIVALPGTDHRTTARMGIVDGRAGFRGRRSDRVVDVEGCLVAHPLLEELIRLGRFGDAEQVMLRVGARTGERLALLHPDATGAMLPDDVVVVGERERRAGTPAWIHEEIAGHRFRISAGSFFQTRPDGAEALVDVVGGAVARHLADVPAHLVDLGAGVGLFSALVPARRVTAVERNRSSAADARVNLADLDATVAEVTAERWLPEAADVVVADPSRDGLGAAACANVAATGASVVVLVSCDVAAGARDVSALVGSGYGVDAVTLVDLFSHTHHVEVVTVLVR
jgi:23S rRNA (uracil1939-C5)-methyltransferase